MCMALESSDAAVSTVAIATTLRDLPVHDKATFESFAWMAGVYLEAPTLSSDNESTPVPDRQISGQKHERENQVSLRRRGSI